MLVTKIQRFSTHDGPGVRTVVFLSGCPLSCRWCHNPEARLYHREVLYSPPMCMGCGTCAKVCPKGAHICDEDGAHILDRSKCAKCLKCAEFCPTGALSVTASDMTAEEIIRTVKRDMDFYDSPDPAAMGGMTLSGGEPLAHPENALSLLRLAKAEGISTAIETSGYFSGAVLPELVPLTDVFLWDFKDGNDARHRENTGVSGRISYENLLSAGAMGARIILRCIMISGLNTDETNIAGIAGAYHKAGCEAVELLPYHPYGESKYSQLGLDAGVDVKYIPSRELLAQIRNDLMTRGVNVKPLR